MADRKNIKNRIKHAMANASARRRLMIIEMPEEAETTPHWLLWLTVAAFIGLVVAIVWQTINTNGNLQAYLPFF